MFNFLKKTSPESNHTQLEFQLSGLHCTNCSLTIDAELEELDGVVNASTSYAKSKTVVDFDAQKISEKEIKGVIEGLGYEVRD